MFDNKQYHRNPKYGFIIYDKLCQIYDKLFKTSSPKQ